MRRYELNTVMIMVILTPDKNIWCDKFQIILFKICIENISFKSNL